MEGRSSTECVWPVRGGYSRVTGEREPKGCPHASNVAWYNSVAFRVRFGGYSLWKRRSTNTILTLGLSECVRGSRILGKEDLERLEAPTDNALAKIGQTCCHRMQISDVADKPYRAHLLLDCALHGPISFDIYYDEGGGTRSQEDLEEEIKKVLSILTPRYKRGDIVRITSNTQHQYQLATISSLKERTSDMAGWVERF
jgi:hypothetical protein